jgi:hypothetical protein
MQEKNINNLVNKGITGHPSAIIKEHIHKPYIH